MNLQTGIDGDGKLFNEKQSLSLLTHLYARELIDLYVQEKIKIEGGPFPPPPETALTFIARSVHLRLRHMRVEIYEYDVVEQYYRDIVKKEMLFAGISFHGEDAGYIHAW